MKKKKIRINSLEELAEYYLYRKVLEPQTILGYRRVISRFAREVTDCIDDLSETLLIDWREATLARTSPATFNHYLRHLKAICRFGECSGVIDYNPFDDLARAPQALKKYKTLESGVFEEAATYLRNNNDIHPGWFWLVLMLFMAYTGVRARQVVHLRWGDIDFDKEQIQLNVAGSKTRREWDIPLIPLLATELWALRERAAALCRARENDYVFNVSLYAKRYKGDQLTIEQITRFYQRLSKKIGCKVSCRRLRHSFATTLANSKDCDIMVIKEILGHSSIQSTQIYTKIKLKRMSKAMTNALGECDPFRQSDD